MGGYRGSWLGRESLTAPPDVLELQKLCLIIVNWFKISAHTTHTHIYTIITVVSPHLLH